MSRRCVTVSYSSGSPRLRVFPSTHSRVNKCGLLVSRRAAAISTVELGFTRDGQVKALSSVGRSVAKSTTRYSGHCANVADEPDEITPNRDAGSILTLFA